MKNLESNKLISNQMEIDKLREENNDLLYYDKRQFQGFDLKAVEDMWMTLNVNHIVIDTKLEIQKKLIRDANIRDLHDYRKWMKKTGRI